MKRMLDVETHACSECKRVFPKSQFPRREGKVRRRVWGWGWCVECERAVQKRVNNSPEGKAAQRRWLEKRIRTQPLKHILKRTRRQAKTRGIPFDLTLEDLAMPAICPIMGIELKLGGPRTDNSASVDRIDNSRGYVKGNVAIISWKANQLKRDGTLEDFRRLVLYVEHKL